MVDDEKQRARAMPALLQVGKNGLSEGFLSELSLLVEKRGMVKVKFLRSFADANETKQAVQSIIKQRPLHTVVVTGNTAVFKKA